MENKYQHKNLIGNRYGKLVVVNKTDKRNRDKKIIWECKCDCGNVVDVDTGGLTSGRVRSCGCLHREVMKKVHKKYITDLKGQKFGKLTVIEQTEERKYGRVVWICKCDCGNIIKVSAGHLINGNTRSCGCIRKEIAPTLLEKRGYVKGTAIGSIKSNKLFSTNKSGYKGINWLESSKKWNAQIMFQRKAYYLGAYDNIEDAIKIRKEAENEVFNKFIEWYNNPDNKKSDFTIELNLDEMRTKLNILPNKKILTKHQNMSELIGKKFGKLTVIKESEKRASNGCVMWECLCECGDTIYVRTDNLKTGKKKSCKHCQKGELTMSKSEFKKIVNKAKNYYEKAQLAEQKLFQILAETYPDIDLEHIPMDEENSYNLKEAITCYMNYSEGDVDEIWEVIKQLKE